MLLNDTCATISIVLVTYRYELPGIRALNFVIGDCLGGGGVASLRIDPQVMNHTFHISNKLDWW